MHPTTCQGSKRGAIHWLIHCCTADWVLSLRWWNLYLHQSGKDLRAVAPMEAEFGSPGWVFGIQNYTALPEGKYGPHAPGPKHARLLDEALMACVLWPTSQIFNNGQVSWHLSLSSVVFSPQQHHAKNGAVCRSQAA